MKRRGWVKLGLGGLVIVVLAYVGAAGALLLREDSIVFRGATFEARNAVPAESTGLDWDTLRVSAQDGVEVLLLESRFSESEEARWALFFHGNASFVGSNSSVARYELLHGAGFNVLAVEFRGYGASARAGPPSEEGLYLDARAGWQHLTETMGVSADRVLLYGYSLGSALATRLAVSFTPLAIVTEGAATSAADIGAARYPYFPVRLLMRNQFDNLARGQEVSAPWLILHGRSDVVVPFSHGEALASIASDVRFVPMDADHDGVIADRETAAQALGDFAAELDQPSGGAAR